MADTLAVKIGTTLIDETFAEAFRMRYVRMIVTADDEYWLAAALREFCGYSASVIACDAEVGIEQRLTAEQTPDGRIGAAVLVFGFSSDALAKAVPNRTGQCLMTCASTAVFDGLAAGEGEIPLGKHLRFFGDGFQKSKLIGPTRYWRIPVMDGEFLVSENLHVEKGVAGGNILIQGETASATISAARRAVEAIDNLPGCITPCAGGAARSGSKVGSRYKGIPASTADAFCPTMRGRTETKLHDGVNSALEIVIDGINEASVADAMRTATNAAAGEGIIAISAGNYGGKLGKFHFHLHQLLANN